MASSPAARATAGSSSGRRRTTPASPSVILKASEEQPMFVTLVHIHVKPDQVDTFLDATRANHEASIREDGNLRFDVLRSIEDPLRFVLYEWYADEAAALRHRDTPHYAVWRDA